MLAFYCIAHVLECLLGMIIHVLHRLDLFMQTLQIFLHSLHVCDSYLILYYPAFCCMSVYAEVDKGAGILRGLAACSKMRGQTTASKYVQFCGNGV